MANKPEKFIAMHIVAAYTATTFEEREALEETIIRVLGCDGTEQDCPMVLLASTVVDSAEAACEWLG